MVFEEPPAVPVLCAGNADFRLLLPLNLDLEMYLVYVQHGIIYFIMCHY